MFIKDGKATSLTLNVLAILGLGIMILSLWLIDIYWVRVLMASIGLAIGSAGGYLAKTQSWGIKPFDKSYENAKKTYQDKDNIS
ncbi:hypothetical protein D3C87_136920 [compost metagenome]